jgi:hypothetical protein
MIENYLLILVKNVKKQTLLVFLCAVLVGCDNAKGLVSFTPEMASFSNEFDFDPLRGPVKDFSQTLLNDKGEVSIRLNCTISKTIPAWRWFWMPTTIAMPKRWKKRSACRVNAS